jgi:hypothetical protein
VPTLDADEDQQGRAAGVGGAVEGGGPSAGQDVADDAEQDVVDDVEGAIDASMPPLRIAISPVLTATTT